MNAHDNATHLAAGRRRLRTAATSIGLAILVALAWFSRHELGEVLAHTDAFRFSIACVLGVLFALTQGVLFSRLILKHSSGHAPHGLLIAFLLSQPGKYVPGKIWSPVMQALVLRQPANVASLVFANVELAIVGMIQMTALGVACLYTSAPALVVAVLATAIVFCIGLMTLPTMSWLTGTLPRVARWLRLPAIGEEKPATNLPSVIALILLSFALNFAASWCVLFAAEASVPVSMRLPILASLYLGFVTSLLALPIPAGIGVREAAAVGLGALLTPQVPAALLLSIAMLTRCWQLLVDASCLGIGALLQLRSGRR